MDNYLALGFLYSARVQVYSAGFNFFSARVQSLALRLRNKPMIYGTVRVRVRLGLGLGLGLGLVRVRVRVS